MPNIHNPKVNCENKVPRKRINFLGIQIDNWTTEEILLHIDQCITRKIPSHVVGLNVDQALRALENEYIKEIFDNAELTFTDGKPIIWLAQSLKQPIIEKVSGPDLMLSLCKRAAIKGYKIFLLGAGTGVAAKAANNIEIECPGLQVVGTYSPPLGFENDEFEKKHINKMLFESNADMLFVGISSPKQDWFIYENMNIYQIPVSFSMGAAIDFLAGNVKRAPKWMSDMGLEWFHRFCHDPKRLFKRYFIDDIRIIKYYIKFQKSLKSNIRPNNSNLRNEGNIND